MQTNSRTQDVCIDVLCGRFGHSELAIERHLTIYGHNKTAEARFSATTVLEPLSLRADEGSRAGSALEKAALRVCP